MCNPIRPIGARDAVPTARETGVRTTTSLGGQKNGDHCRRQRHRRPPQKKGAATGGSDRPERVLASGCFSFQKGLTGRVASRPLSASSRLHPLHPTKHAKSTLYFSVCRLLILSHRLRPQATIQFPMNCQSKGVEKQRPEL